VPLNDLQRQTTVLGAELSAAIQRVVESGWYILGKECAAFEAEFADYCGVRQCIAVANGTDALELALRSLGIGLGDVVATAANAGGYATAAIRQIGAESLYVDVDAERMTICPRDLAARLTPQVRAVIATHLYGRMADLPGLLAVTDRAGVPIIEDCAQAHGAALSGRKAGSWSALGCFSFYPTKNLGGLGDGGAVTTNDSALAERVKSLRQYGWSTRYKCAEYGRNSRLDEMQAAILRAKLPHLDGWNARRREIAKIYSCALAEQSVACPQEFGEDYVAHLYLIRSERRDELRASLKARGIATDVHYPIPDHRQEAARGTAAARTTLPVTERLAQEILTLPCFAELREDEIAAVAAALAALPKEARVG
jgi:dTDP-4-amino-4,6-dideoxygalactose transaminase